MESLEYEESLFSSLLGEGLVKDSLLFATGVEGTPDDKYAVSAENVFQDLGPLGDPFADSDWMTEKYDFSLLDQTEVFLQPESTLSSELDELFGTKEAIESLEVGPDDLELLQSLAVDPGIPPISPAPGETHAPDLLALSPTSSVSSVAESGPGSPSILMVNPPVVELPASDILTTFVQIEQNKEMVDCINLIPEQYLTPPLSPESTTDTESAASPKDTKNRETPKRARSKVKSVSGSKIIDKKSRKRGQNKVAATRYREKKRAESLASLSVEDKLVQRNTDLKEQVESLAREIKYMKDLMVDVFHAKGISTEKILL